MSSAARKLFEEINPVSQNPYEDQPPRAFWRRAVSDVTAETISDIYKPRYAISKTDAIAAAGSCFAQHIGKQFKDRGYNFMDKEPPPGLLPREAWHQFGFDLYSARYGNVYSVRQLLQLFQSAYGDFEPCEKVWETGGRFYDPLRPNIEPGGFATELEVIKAREYHLQRVRRLLKHAEIFVFTFGLTEAWICVEDGTVLPSCPGTLAGTFDPERYKFHNFSFSEVLADAEAFMELAMKRNRNMRFLFTVSPVPLTATATDSHVLAASVYSKSVLRAVVGELYAKYDNVDYFPSYELIASHPARGIFFAPNMRNVTPEGVGHAMQSFFAAHGSMGEQAETVRRAPQSKPKPAKDRAQAEDDVVCEDEILEMFSQ